MQGTALAQNFTPVRYRGDMKTSPTNSHAAQLHPKRGESHAGYFMRLAETLEWGSISHAAKALGVSMADLRWGPRQRRGNSIRVSGHRLPMWVVEQHRRRVCPSCLQEDHFIREWWEISLITACPIHQVSLFDACACGDPLTWNDVRVDGCCIREGKEVHQGVETSQFERWLAECLGIVRSPKTPNTWLDGLGLSRSLRLLENVSALAASEYSAQTPYTATETELRRLELLRGFDILMGDGFEAIVDRTVKMFRSTHAGGVPKRLVDALGWFGDWLNDEDFPSEHPMVQRVATAVEAAYDLEPLAPATNVISIAALAAELGLAESEVSRRLADAFGVETFRGLVAPGLPLAE